MKSCWLNATGEGTEKQSQDTQKCGDFEFINPSLLQGFVNMDQVCGNHNIIQIDRFGLCTLCWRKDKEVHLFARSIAHKSLVAKLANALPFLLWSSPQGSITSFVLCRTTTQMIALRDGDLPDHPLWPHRIVWPRFGAKIVPWWPPLVRDCSGLLLACPSTLWRPQERWCEPARGERGMVLGGRKKKSKGRSWK